MELFIYDESLALKGVIDAINTLVWTRRYHTCGEFKLLVPFTEAHAKYLVKDRIIYKRGDDEGAQIEYVHISKNAEGLEEIEVQGKFLLSWMGRRVVLKQIIRKAKMRSNLYKVVTDNAISPTNAKRKIPLLYLDPTDTETGESAADYVTEPYADAQITIEENAKDANLGVRVRTDIKAKKHYFSVYKGRDLTSDQSINPPCVFSQEFDNITEQEYTNSVENLKSTAYVGGEDAETGRKVAEVGTTAQGLARREMFVNATDITQTYTDEATGQEVTLTDAQYLTYLSYRGTSELKGRAETLAFASTINTFTNLKYREDYDLGDRVTCVNRRWGIKINVYITEITETYQAGVEDVDVTFGESLPALTDKIRQIAKG